MPLAGAFESGQAYRARLANESRAQWPVISRTHRTSALISKDDELKDRDAFVEKMKARLDEWKKDIDRLEAQAEGLKADTQTRIQHQLDELKTARHCAIQCIQAIQNASVGVWETTRHGAEAA